ncbi:hypothetical protein [Planobispora takensis]|uniref:Uncharacterized protein n=1 Tax=Planobispora takensis TaxID=1367882 RepID=A0A8J3T2Y8_9ACTN|nr:hypothetical protein [Planobispora takensis]GII03105.1 hypothetical protein Pta02_51130 [Planobispora takensis]
MIGRIYLERGRPVAVLIRWGSAIRPGEQPARLTVLPAPSGRAVPAHGTGPRNVLIRRADGSLIVRPFRGLHRPTPDKEISSC